MQQVAPTSDLFAMRFNNKWLNLGQQEPDSLALAVYELSLSREDLHPDAFPPGANLDKMVEKLQDYPHRIIILIAPGWIQWPC